MIGQQISLPLSYIVAYNPPGVRRYVKRSRQHVMLDTAKRQAVLSAARSNQDSAILISTVQNHSHDHRVGLQHSHCACLGRTNDTPRCPQGTVAAPLRPWWCAVVHSWCWQALKQHNTITLTITKRYTKRDKLNPYVHEQLCDYA